MHKDDLALNNLRWLICHKSQTNQTQPTNLPNSFSITVFGHFFFLVKSLGIGFFSFSSR